MGAAGSAIKKVKVAFWGDYRTAAFFKHLFCINMLERRFFPTFAPTVPELVAQ